MDAIQLSDHSGLHTVHRPPLQPLQHLSLSPSTSSTSAEAQQSHTTFISKRQCATLPANAIPLSALQEDEAATRQLNRERRMSSHGSHRRHRHRTHRTLNQQQSEFSKHVAHCPCHPQSDTESEQPLWDPTQCPLHSTQLVDILPRQRVRPWRPV